MKIDFPTLGFTAIDWIEEYCIHGPGDVQNEPVKMTVEEMKFVLDVYRLEPNGKRSYKRAMLVRPKGWAKSELAAFIALFEAFGPCRFDFWDKDGEPVGKPVQTPIIRCVATEETQAGNVYDNILHNLTYGSLADINGVDAGYTRCLLPGGGDIRPVSAGASSKDGGKETFVVQDESHLWILPELHRLNQTYLRNLRKRTASDPWSLEITTAYRPGENSVAETGMQYAAKIAAGEAFDAGFFYDHRQASTLYDLDDPEQHMLALKEAYGDCTWVDFEQIVRDWQDPTTDPVDHRRYYLSQIVQASDAFLDPAEWSLLADATMSLADKDTISLGIDTSLVDDGTAVVACRLEDGFISVLGYWQKPKGSQGINWIVPYEEVDSCVRAAFDTYNVTRVYCDPQYVSSQMEQWQIDYGKRVYGWYTNRPKPMAEAVQRFYTAVKTKTALKHSGDTLLATHVGNARTFMSAGRILVRKDSKYSTKKIDALIAAILAYEARADSLTAGEDKPQVAPRKRVWSYGNR